MGLARFARLFNALSKATHQADILLCSLCVFACGFSFFSAALREISFF